MESVEGELGEGREDERHALDLGARQYEPVLPQDPIAEQQQIEIEAAWRVAGLTAVAAEARLDPPERGVDLGNGLIAVEGGDPVVEIITVETHGRACIDGRDRQGTEALGEGPETAGDVGTALNV